MDTKFRSDSVTAGGTRIEDQRAFLNRKMAPFLVSFPRTGSHWLRVMLESYTDRPLHTRSFLSHNNADYLLYHIHDCELTERPLNVIYLSRSPVQVIFSQLSYYDENINDKPLIENWSKSYARHLIHWLLKENFTQKKTTISYEELKANPYSQLINICHHLSLEYDHEKWKIVLAKIDKPKVKTLTAHDASAVNISYNYENKRARFFDQSANHIKDIFSKECHRQGVDTQLIWKY